MSSIPETDYRVLSALSAKREPVALEALAAELALDQSQVAAVCLTRAALGELALTEQVELELRLSSKGRALCESGFPERAIAAALARAGGAAELPALGELSGLPQKDVGQSLRWLKGKQWAEQQGKALRLLPAGEQALAGAGPDEQLVQRLAQGPATAAQLAAEGLDAQAALAALAGRGLIDERERKRRLVALADAGRALLAAGLRPRQQLTQLSDELLRSGAWREADLRPYDVTLPVEPVYPGKIHPMVNIVQQTRRVFLELGFSETVSPYVEAGFWDFDALFQPQDHPARDMQDTFYVARPTAARLPAAELVETVRRTHESGGETGSLGWRYSWNVELARKVVLRTHTTAGSIRALAADPRPPRKVFAVGPVFRRETVDYKHLPVFHQVDGIIVDEHATFATLLGTLSAFYRKMGFQRFQFRPAFFPYTEPSVEIFVWAERKRDWVEMGGAGVFRPEVTQPFGCQVPVLAWGLGLERLAMFRYELSSIGELYRARLGWLKETPLCR